MTIEKLVLAYQANKDDALFTEIYTEARRECLPNSSYVLTMARSIGATQQEVIELFDDSVMYAVDKYIAGKPFILFLKMKFKGKRTNFLRDSARIRQYESLEMDAEPFEETPTLRETLADETVNVEIDATRKADQRQLIDFLLDGADATTTAIVDTFLNQPDATLTAIKSKLELKHHSVVTRKLEKLASKFDSKLYGSHRDYLVAL